MSKITIEGELLEELRRILNNPKMAARDFLQWSTMDKKTTDQNLMVVKVDRMGAYCLVARTADKRVADKTATSMTTVISQEGTEALKNTN